MGNDNSTNAASKSVRLSNLTAVTTSESPSIENKEDITLIWLDKTIDTLRTTLREVTNYVLLYTEIEPCITYIRSINTERIFLIISGVYAEQCLDEIHDLTQIDSIFIFCKNLDKYKSEFVDTKKYSKLINVFNTEDELIKSVREELNDLHNQLATFSLYKNEKTTRDLSNESASFLWFQLFKDILLQMSHSEQAKKEMIDQCKHFYRGNIEELRLIKEFDETYTNSDTIYWYTKQCFIYRLCNKALRTEDIELLYIFRYYIHDLCKRLAIEYDLFKKQHENNPIITLYRGLKLTNDEINRFKSNISSLISTNGFLSTSQNYDLAIEFALKKSKRSADIVPALFIIEADTRIDHAIFADVSSLSVYPEEQEILFDIGCAFKINEVYFDDEKNIWIIKMNLTNEGRQIIQTYIKENRREMEKGNIVLIFGLLLTEMGQYKQAEIYFENLLSSNTIDDKISIYTNIGRIKYFKGLFDEALKDFKIVYDLQRQQTSKNEIDLARTMNNLGLVYMEQKKYDLAFDYLFEVRKIYKKYSDIDKSLVANTDNVIGVIYTHKCDYENALKYLLRAMKYYEEYLPTIDHPLMATNYNNIGLVYYYIKEYKQSFDYCLKAFNIREKILPKNHPNFGDSCNNLGLIYQKLHEYKQAYDFFQRSLSIYENNPDKQTKIPACYNNIGFLYIDEKNYDEAIEYHLKALNYYNNNESSKYQNEINHTLDNLGTAYDLKNDTKQALNYYKQALESIKHDHNQYAKIALKIGNIYQKNGEYDLALDYYLKAINKNNITSQDTLSNLFMAIGIVYHQQKNYASALDYYKRTLSILKKLSSDNELNLVWIYNNIGCLYTDIDDSKHALKYQEKAYNIRIKFLPPNHPDIATSLTNLGRIYQKLAHYSNGLSNDLERALEYYKAALEIRQESLSNNHPDIAISYYNLALIYFDQQNLYHAHINIEKALDIQRNIFSSEHPQLQQTLQLEKNIRNMLGYHKN
ncbi:unnamed protein product [Adineta steineri]|uniref:ADP ribosyltransferase domain-containing protein n=1 Tax=Adineta steineri TaxID=433720 RepID=A0A819A834_9BILA|nr:unnamed protein product [Adineta steineri]CAF3781376.1 unnamed protein product [Adineta steineri]